MHDGKIAWIIAASLVVQLGCSVKKISIDTTADLLANGRQAMDSEPDLEIARAAAPGQLKTVEGLLVSAPHHRTLLAMAAQGCLEFAFGFLEDDVESLSDARDAGARRAASVRATAMYDRALDHALGLLENDDRHIRAAFVRGGPAWDVEVGRLPRSSVAGLTFGGIALASAINLNRGDPARLTDLPKARAMLRRAHVLDPRFYFGGAAMALAMMSAQQGEKDAARRYFNEAIATAGDFLLPRVMMAKTLYAAPEDREKAIVVYREVLAVPVERAPEIRLANEIARRRAARELRALAP